MTLRELARRLDVSASLVSQIETGKSQPSVRTLYAMVAELGLSLDEMLELAGRNAGPLRLRGGDGRSHRTGSTIVERAEHRRVLEFASGVRWERLAAWDDPDVEFLMTTYVVGSSSSADGRLTRHSGLEFGLVLGGTLKVTVGFEEHVLEPGDSITFPSTTPHRLQNEGPGEARAIWVALGPSAARPERRRGRRMNSPAAAAGRPASPRDLTPGT